MQLTDYHAKYFAHELTRRFPPDSVEKLTGALVDAQVDLNPHQIDAALFAFRSPLSKGAVMADEVGLGKTIEAGLVLSQKWAERKRRILVITPANLRKQWYQKLTEKFFLPCRILETESYNAAIKLGHSRPFEAPDIVICSYQFARSKAGDVAGIPWDLVVIDEAHRLRNVYKPSNVIANTLKGALGGKDKLLLTATPLQNSLLELFGLVSFVDEHAFGDLKSFREQFTNLYELPRRSGEAHLYRRTHPLAEAVLARAKDRDLPLAEIEFAYSTYEGRITLLEPLIGKSGWLTVHLFSVESLDQAEDYVLCAAATDEGQALDDAVAARLLTLPGKSSPLPLGDTPNECPLPLGDTPNYSPLPMGEGRGEGAMRAVLSAIIEQRQASIQRGISERNARFFEAEAEKLDGWADDLKLGLEREIKELDRQIKEARRAATTALTLEEKLAGQKRIKALESQRNEKRRSLFDAQDEVDRQRDSLIASIEGKLAQRITSAALFSARWELR